MCIRDSSDRSASLVFTSGTTGLPKAAKFTEGALAAVARLDLGADATRWGGGAPMFVSTQFAHVGLMTKLCWYVRRGSRLHLVDRWRADDVLALVAAEAMTVIGACLLYTSDAAAERSSVDLWCRRII